MAKEVNSFTAKSSHGEKRQRKKGVFISANKEENYFVE